MTLPLRGLIDVTFGDQELMVDFLSANPLRAQDPCLFPNGPSEIFLCQFHELQGVDFVTMIPINTSENFLQAKPSELAICAILGISILPEALAGAEPTKQHGSGRRPGVRRSLSSDHLAEVLSQQVCCKHARKACSHTFRDSLLLSL